MSAQHLSLGKQVLWHGESFEIKQILPNHQVNLESILTGAVTTADINQLVADLYDGLLVFVQEGKHVKRCKDQTTPQAKYVDLSNSPQHLIDIAHFRLWVIEPLLDLRPRTRQAVADRVKEVNDALATGKQMPGACTMCVATVYQWIADYERSRRDLRALIPNYDERGGRGKWRIEPEVEVVIALVIEEAYARREKTTVEDIRHEIAARIDDENKLRAKQDCLSYPSRETLERRIDVLDVKQVFVIKHGKRAAERQFTQFGKGPEAGLPLERVEIDHTPIDLIVIDPNDNLPLGRATLTDCMDIATRYPLGYYLGFEPPSYYAVMECLYHAICPKGNVMEKYGTMHDWLAYGTPYTLVTDNGKEFIGRDLEDACLALSIVLERAPIRTPHYKGKIERLFKSIATVVHGLPGTTFSNPGERGDYNSVKQACIYLDEVDAILNHFFIDIHAERKHRGIGGVPAWQWEQAIESGFLPRLPASSEELVILLGKVDWRTIQPYGIDFECIRYNAPELALLRHELPKDEKAKIKFHPGDLSRIYLYNPLDGQYILAPALDQEYTRDLSLWKHRVIRRFVLSQQDTVDLAALGRAKRAIQDIVDQARSRKRTGTRSRIARWNSSGQPASLADRQTSAEAMATLPRSPQRVSEPTMILSPQVVDLPSGQPADQDVWSVTYDLPMNGSRDWTIKVLGQTRSEK